MAELTPKEIVDALDQFIVGQAEAKRAVAIALRNRWRRMQLPKALQAEITPKNILMIGPTGVGKTEIARRLASLANAPFIKVEATKFTEVGYVGKEVDSIIRDLVEVSLKLVKERAGKAVEAKASALVHARLLDALLPGTGAGSASSGASAREHLSEKLLSGELEEALVEISLSLPQVGMEIVAPPGMEEMTQQLQGMFERLSGTKAKAREMTVREARALLLEEALTKLIDFERLKREAIETAEQQGIVFIDEIDKLCRQHHQSAGEVSREGVQRDLLPLVEGCTVSTKYGAIKTDYILFIASGAFQTTTPSQLIPELQGRLPIRVSLNALSAQDFERILTEPKAALTEQYRALMETEGIRLTFTEEGIAQIAESAFQVNERTENIGARRLHTVLEKLLEEISFESGAGEKRYEIDQHYVRGRLASLVKNEDLLRFVL